MAQIQNPQRRPGKTRQGRQAQESHAGRPKEAQVQTSAATEQQTPPDTASATSEERPEAAIASEPKTPHTDVGGPQPAQPEADSPTASDKPPASRRRPPRKEERQRKQPKKLSRPGRRGTRTGGIGQAMTRQRWRPWPPMGYWPSPAARPRRSFTVPYQRDQTKGAQARFVKTGPASSRRAVSGHWRASHAARLGGGWPWLAKLGPWSTPYRQRGTTAGGRRDECGRRAVPRPAAPLGPA